jgi:NAD(P)-dependent dehydrogenase (short-subunit alcohol dehydrogenase family)
VRQDYGRLDLLINNAWGGYEGYEHHGGEASVFDAVFWEQPIERWDKMWTAGVRATLATTKAAVPLMFSQRKGMIFNTTLEIDPTFYDAALYYRTAKLAINYLTFGMAHYIYQRGGFPIAVIGLAMGWRISARGCSRARNSHKQTPPSLADTLSLPWQTIQMSCRKRGRFYECAIWHRNMGLRMLIDVMMESKKVTATLRSPLYFGSAAQR